MRLIKPIAVIACLSLFGAGCEIPTIATSPVVDTGVGESVVKTGEMCAQTPQVFYFNKLAFTAAELTNIQSDVVEPFTAYYRTLPGNEVVSMFIKRTTTGIVVDAIIDQPGSDDPVYNGFVLDRQKDGTYPLWQPEDAGPDFRG